MNPALGARLLGDARGEFRVWAPALDRVQLHIVGPADRRVSMEKRENGYHEAVVDGVSGETRYFYVLGDSERPDPASRLQPDGVHGPSQVVGRDFPWTDKGWKNVPLEDYVLYELHVGAFTGEGTFDAVITRLDHLKDLGVTAIELLPVAQFPGERNWGYDGVYAGAAQNSYGGPVALKRLVDACHGRGMAILLDAVYNHLGPEGNYLREYGPYFTDRYRTPWGQALNFDGPQSDHVRWYFIHNALQWVDEFHFDGLRIDAVHAIVDHSAEPFLQDLNAAVHERAAEIGRPIHMIAESDLNDPRVITPGEELGLGFDSQWSDDFHHALHTLLTKERAGYYAGYGRASDLARVIRNGYLYTGQYSVFRGRKYGAKPKTTDGKRFVVCAQNHDQIGNRMLGDRLSSTLTHDKVRLSAAVVVLSPFLPMLFMGEEYGETAPFQYFTSHSDEDLIQAVRDGRRAEFEDFAWEGEAPDPHDRETFRRSKLNWRLLDRDEHRAIRQLYHELLRIRRETPALRKLDLASLHVEADDDKRVVVTHRGDVFVAFNFSESPQTVEIATAPWRALMETGAALDGNLLTIPANAFAILRQ